MKKTALNGCLLVLVALVTSFATTTGQELDETLFTVGTTIDDGEGNPWAYVLWNSGKASLLQEKAFAIFAKEGDADSANPYQLRSVVKIQTNVKTINALLKRSESLGADLGVLEQHIDELFGSYMPKDDLQLPEKLGYLIAGAQEAPDLFSNLIFLGRTHPGIALCLGWGYAGKITPGAKTTYEVRQCPIGTLAPDKNWEKVVGRVTVEAGNPLVLPAPGPVIAVPEENPKGDLNIKLRWGTPDNLRRLTLLQFGFDVYRIDADYAEAQNFDDNAPSPGVLPSLAKLQQNKVQLANQAAVTPLETLSLAAAEDLAVDPTTFFVIDSNDRFFGGEGFQDGDRFYYFAVARDALGRPGVSSPPGKPITICDRMPPMVPKGVKVENDYQYDRVQKSRRQVLKVSWKPNVPKPNEKIASYFVYRWEDVSHMHANAKNPGPFQIAGPIPHVPGVETYSVLDTNEANVPGRTYWYSVRALDASSCGGNLSGDSAPAFGVLRDREGPDKPGGGVEVFCGRPVVEFVEDSTRPAPQGEVRDPECLHLHLSATAQNEALEWIEWYRGRPGADGTTLIARRYFQRRGLLAEFHTTLCDLDLHPPIIEGNPPAASQNPKIFAVVGAFNGQISDPTFATNVGFFSDGKTYELEFFAKFEPGYLGADENDCGPHISVDPIPDNNNGGIDAVNKIKLTLDLTPGTKEWKVYRRVNDGDLTLIKQGLDDFDQNQHVALEDGNLPQNASSCCYFVQTFDEHGNSSPMSKLNCVDTTAKSLPQAPLLSVIEKSGNMGQPTAIVRWFSPPEGIERFRVFVGKATNNPPPEPEGFGLKAGPCLPGVVRGLCFVPYLTPRVGTDGFEGPEFSIEIPIAKGAKYHVFLEAITPAGQRSPWSNAETFRWAPPQAYGPNVPWPALSLPEVSDAFDDRIATRPIGTVGFGVRIGDYPKPSKAPDAPIRFRITGTDDPMDHIFTNTENGDVKMLFPCALYRYQVSNDLFPKVSGDVYQVSPLMENIAHDKTTNGRADIYDPFVADQSILSEPDVHGIFLLDTQPVVVGAAYRHLLVRFTSRGEVAQVIPLNEVEFAIVE